ncbi:hypothetical protein [Nocardia testacea]|uniref:hypothetical protein n=1 Tax=Nocardia testacea TaxID=248551 RepID=UPI00031874AD|nr:hypothetical protein [Nocardia testacea]
MNADEIMVLLQVAQSYDSRNIDRLMQSAWLDASQRARWDRDAALVAVRAHYAESTERIMPGHVTARIRAARPAPGYAPKYQRELLPAPPATTEQREEARRLFVPTGRTQGGRKPGLSRRWRREAPVRGTEGGPEPQRAFAGDLGAIIKGARKDAQ